MKVESWKWSEAGEVEQAEVVALFRQGLAAQRPPDERTAVAARALLAEWLAVPRTGVLIARAQGRRLVGLIVFRNEPPSVRILFICAREPRKGVGTALVRALAELAAGHGSAELRAGYSERDERASGFYRKLGFTVAGSLGEVVPGWPLILAALPLGGAGKARA